MKNRLIEVYKEYRKKHIIRYFIMAVFVVCIELGVFALINSGLKVTYLIATPLSMFVGIVLNWYFSKAFVFSGSRHKTHIEFTLVLVSSLVGVVIQLVVTTICIRHFHLLPIAGKFMAIVVTFFWNYWFRKKYVFIIA